MSVEFNSTVPREHTINDLKFFGFPYDPALVNISKYSYLNVYSWTAFYSVACISIRSSSKQFSVFFFIGFLIFCLLVLSVSEGDVFISSTIIGDLSIVPFTIVNLCFKQLEPILLGTHRSGIEK